MGEQQFCADAGRASAVAGDGQRARTRTSCRKSNVLSLDTASRRWLTLTVAAFFDLHTLLALLTRSSMRSSRHFEMSTGAALATLPTSCPTAPAAPARAQHPDRESETSAGSLCGAAADEQGLYASARGGDGMGGGGHTSSCCMIFLIRPVGKHVSRGRLGGMLSPSLRIPCPLFLSRKRKSYLCVFMTGENAEMIVFTGTSDVFFSKNVSRATLLKPAKVVCLFWFFVFCGRFEVDGPGWGSAGNEPPPTGRAARGYRRQDGVRCEHQCAGAP